MSLPVSIKELEARVPRDPALTKAMQSIAEAMQSDRDDEMLKLIANAIAQAKPADITPALNALAGAIAEMRRPVSYECEVTERDSRGKVSKWVFRPIKGK